MMNKEEIDGIIEKYYMGEASADEEALLRAFFSDENIPEEYKTEKELFGYFMDRTIIPEPKAGFEENIIKSIRKNEKAGDKIFSIPAQFLPYLSIAAGILIIIGLWFFTSRNKTVDSFNDPQLAYNETMRVLFDVSSRMNRGVRTMEPVSRINEETKFSSEILNKPAVLIRNNLESLDYFQKAFDMTGINIDNKNR